MEHFVIIVNGWKPLTIISKSSILDVAAVLGPPLTVCGSVSKQNMIYMNLSIKVQNFSFESAITDQKYSAWMINAMQYV